MQAATLQGPTAIDHAATLRSWGSFDAMTEVPPDRRPDRAWVKEPSRCSENGREERPSCRHPGPSPPWQRGLVLLRSRSALAAAREREQANGARGGERTRPAGRTPETRGVPLAGPRSDV